MIFRRLVIASLLGATSLATSSAFAQAAAPIPPQPTELRADHLDMQSTDDETRAICTGNVVLTGTNMRIVCDRLEVIARRIGDKDATIGDVDRFKYLLATGRVKIVQGDREATCGRAEVLPPEGKVILTENPVLTDHSNGWVTAGDKFTLLRGQRQVLIENPRSTGPSIPDLGPGADKALQGAPKQP
ncbi:MAG TPA: LptA/OstA family protein [Opitutaceae bacterium]